MLTLVYEFKRSVLIENIKHLTVITYWRPDIVGGGDRLGTLWLSSPRFELKSRIL